MAGNLIVGPRSMPQPQYAGEPFDTAGLWVGEQVNSVEALVQKSADVLYAPGGSAAWNGTDWEQISLAIHRLSTNGVHYRSAKKAATYTHCLFASAWSSFTI